MYRVMRSVVYSNGTYDPPYAVWEGEIPSNYTEGIGAFDEGDYSPCRWFEIQLEDKSWIKIDDPRKKI